MNVNPVTITLHAVSKTYNLYKKPSHRVKELLHPFRKKYSQQFDALKDISFDICKGETVGIVGRNGCGKSTLLQIVCGIFPPTTGAINVNGRISAILELGAGFNPEFNGRDNVYLNCSILGIDRAAADLKMDEILSFADIGDFIDQPVKTYSSGMVVRLAFSIAINVDPAILIVDEALAVGDAAFQRKCFSRIKKIQEDGATILFVSHSATAVVELCDRAILLDGGEHIFTGDPKTVVSLYHKLLFAPPEKLASVKESVLEDIAKLEETITDQSKTGEKEKQPAKNISFYNENLMPKSTTWYEPNGALICDPHIQTLEGEKANTLNRNEEYVYTFKVVFSQSAHSVRFGMLIKTVSGLELGGYGNLVDDENMKFVTKGSNVEVQLRFKCALLPGTYFLNAGVRGIINTDDEYLHRGIDVSMFEVIQEDRIFSTGIVDFSVSSKVLVNK